MAFVNRSDLKSQAAARTKAYGAKVLGSFQNGKILHNEATHPDHAKFGQLDHMRAASIHSTMANEAEQNRKYLESAHHRKQAAHHKAAWQGMTRQPGSLYKSLRSAMQAKGGNPLKDTLNHGEDLKKEMQGPPEPPTPPGIDVPIQVNGPAARMTKALKLVPPTTKVSVESHPKDVIDVDPEILSNMRRRLNPNVPLANTLRLLEVVQKLNGARPDYDPKDVATDTEFKQKLDGVLHKAQFAQTGSPEERKASKKTEQVKKDAMKRLGKQLRSDTLKYLRNQKGQALASENPGSKDRAKSTRRNLKNVKPGEQLNKPEK